MNICIISASMRSKSQSRKVADYLQRRVVTLNHEANVLDLNELQLPLYNDEGFDNHEPQSLQELKRRLVAADGYVFVSPEWDGMMSYGLINMFLYIKNEMAHKPVMLTGVSSGRGGTYPIAQMKQLGQKNKHFVITPENLIVSQVKDVMNDDTSNQESNDYVVKQRADYALKILLLYAEKLVSIRESDIIDFDRFASGV